MFQEARGSRRPHPSRHPGPAGRGPLPRSVPASWDTTVPLDRRPRAWAAGFSATWVLRIDLNLVGPAAASPAPAGPLRGWGGSGLAHRSVHFVGGTSSGKALSPPRGKWGPEAAGAGAWGREEAPAPHPPAAAGPARPSPQRESPPQSIMAGLARGPLPAAGAAATPGGSRGAGPTPQQAPSLPHGHPLLRARAAEGWCERWPGAPGLRLQRHPHPVSSSPPEPPILPLVTVQAVGAAQRWFLDPRPPQPGVKGLC